MTIYSANANDLAKEQLISIINKQTEVMLEDEKEITALKEREAKLVEALKFYADIDNSRVTSCDDIDGEHSPTMSGGLYLTGKKARETLKELGVENV